jgi:chromosome segregation protein
VHLERLTLRGFKSFASATTLHFEPGLTCVVGPNGSGKSNVVDAIAWVLGEQGAKALRGGTMSDVIFAGTPNRPPLGRAEVQLTIDNSDGALPIDYAEVTIGRLMFRSGESEYSINGQPCRLLDVQELMSDSGIGRELHVVVGQGQLDAVLGARPEDRRAFIEEAAGVLKHRKRKEKALRKLEAMSANLARVSDLSAELRRQLGPLGRQAEAARKAGAVQATVRDARLRLLADDLVSARAQLVEEREAESTVRTRLTEVEAQLAESREREAQLGAAAEADTPALGAARATVSRLTQLREQLRGIRSLAEERTRHLQTAEPIRLGRNPEELEREAASVEQEEAGLQAQLEAERQALGEATRRRSEAETALSEEEAAVSRAIRAAADRREGLARLQGSVEAVRNRIVTREGEIERLTSAAAAARARAEVSGEELAGREADLSQLDEGELGLDERHEAAAAALAEAEERLRALGAEEREAERERTGWQARRDALQLTLARAEGAAAIAEALGDRAAPATGAMTVEAGAEAALATALGAAADGWSVPHFDDALSAVLRLHESDAGRAAMLVTGLPRLPTPAAPPAGLVWARDLVRAPEELAGALDRLLVDVAVADEDQQAEAVRRGVAAGLRVVTRAGDLAAEALVVGGPAGGRSALELTAERDAAEDQLAEAVRRGERARFALAAARQERERALIEVEAALAELHDSDARMSAVAEQLADLASTVRAAQGEAERLETARSLAEQSLGRDREELATLEARLETALQAPEETERSTEERDRLAAETTSARGAEVEARLAVRTAEERVQAMSGRAASLRRAATAEREARARAEAARKRRERQAAIALVVTELAGRALDRLESSLEQAGAELAAAEESARTRHAALSEARDAVRALSDSLGELREQLHRDEVGQVERRLRVESLETSTVEEYGVSPEDLIAGFGPDIPVPAEAEGPEGSTEPTPYDREAQQARLATAEKALARLGKVNPLALEEYEALQERSAFLATQLRDLENTRRDLLHVVKEVDDRVQEVFRSAFEDTAREFEIVFATLFPGGHGKLVLTDPDDLLSTGIEVEARPAGKKVARLSLLSGGERSLAALALLLAIFRARPSPFYVLDEVEAALDDRNLGRLLEAIEGLRERAQLIVITHQKRTMENADALYGVTMRGDGVSTVISQRLREKATA